MQENTCFRPNRILSSILNDLKFWKMQSVHEQIPEKEIAWNIKNTHKNNTLLHSNEE